MKIAHHKEHEEHKEDTKEGGEREQKADVGCLPPTRVPKLWFGHSVRMSRVRRRAGRSPAVNDGAKTASRSKPRRAGLQIGIGARFTGLAPAQPVLGPSFRAGRYARAESTVSGLMFFTLVPNLR